MLELKKPQIITVDKFLSEIGKSLGQKVDIKTSITEVTIVCKKEGRNWLGLGKEIRSNRTPRISGENAYKGAQIAIISYQ